MTTDPTTGGQRYPLTDQEWEGARSVNGTGHRAEDATPPPAPAELEPDGPCISCEEGVERLARLVAELEQQAHQWAESTHSLRPTDIDHRYMQGVRQCGADLLAILEAERRGPAGEAPTRQSEPLAQRGPTNNVQEA